MKSCAPWAATLAPAHCREPQSTTSLQDAGVCFSMNQPIPQLPRADHGSGKQNCRQVSQVSAAIGLTTLNILRGRPPVDTRELFAQERQQQLKTLKCFYTRHLWLQLTDVLLATTSAAKSLRTNKDTTLAVLQVEVMPLPASQLARPWMYSVGR